MTTKTRLLAVLLSLNLIACPAFLPILARVAQAAQYLGALIDAAEAGAAAFHRRHPNLETETRVSASLKKARYAAAALNGALAAASSAEDGDVVRARREALDAYEELLALMNESGILEGKAPEGGAENEAAPLPGPIPMPNTERVALLFKSVE